MELQQKTVKLVGFTQGQLQMMMDICEELPHRQARMLHNILTSGQRVVEEKKEDAKDEQDGGSPPDKGNVGPKDPKQE